MTNNPSETEESINFSDYFYMLRKSWGLALLVFIIIMGAAIAYTLLSPKIYQSRSLVLVTTQDQSSILLGQSLAKTDIETQKELIMSSSVMNSVYAVTQGQMDFNVIVSSVKTSNVIEIKAESSSPTIAMKVANQVAISYVNYTREARKDDAKEVSDFISRQLTTYKVELDALNLKIIAYENKRKISNVTVAEELEYQSLKQAFNAKEELYNYLLSRAEEVNIVAQEELGNVRIIEYASLPQQPVRPNVLINLSLGFILAIIGALGIAFLRFGTIKTFRNIEEVESGLGLNVIGTLPWLKHYQFTSPKGGGGAAYAIETAFTKPIAFFRTLFTSKGKGDYFILDYTPEGPFADSVRMLKTNIAFGMKEKDIKLISVTSPDDKDGKSTVATNLALEFVYSGKKVLLVDANIRNPRLEQVFKQKTDEAGLSDIILGEAKINDVIRKTHYKNLFLITAGQHRDFSNELLSSESIKELCAKLKNSTADIVIIDNSSLRHAESINISGHCQAVLLVMAHERTTKDSALKAKNVLRKVKANVLGVVINFFK
ncbi:MAG TPA: polysaccharide biosynthesis tyrosine autokinase [Candidatus Nanoarchaeia archaeon]|nr:polysaccharide biosynthesis tyrosine autokinase [Candidatus Nanoarchaeia archaeon]